MRSSHKVSALLATLVLALSLAGGVTAAQDATPVDLQPGDLDGIQYGVDRSYHAEIDAVTVAVARRPGESTPPPAPEATPSAPADVVSLGGSILQFDSAENAKSALHRIHDAVSPAILGVGADMLEFGLGDEEFSYAWVEEFDDEQLDVMVVTLVQHERYVYLVNASGSGQDLQAQTRDFANHLIENEGSGEGEFNEDGTSSGGLWDKFPEADNELIAGLIPYDGVVYPDPESTPEAPLPCGCTPPLEG